MKKRIISLVMLLSLVTSLMSCAGDGTGVNPSADGAGNGTETTEYPLPVKNFGNEKFTVYTRWYTDGWDWNVNDIYSEENSGDTISNAVHIRNTRVEERYNIEIEQVKDGLADDAANIRTILLSGEDTYDAIIMSGHVMGTLGQEELLYDLMELDNIDPYAEYWNPTLTDVLTLNGKLYYAMGDLSATDNRAVRCLYFNKDLFEKYAIEDPYELVKSGKWTHDKFFEIIKSANFEIDGDGKMTENDIYGLLTQPSIGVNLYYSTKNQFVSKDENDLLIPSFADDIDVMQGISDGVTEALPYMYVSDDYNKLLDMFAEGHGLFYAEVLIKIETMRQNSLNVGILPMPKLDEAQEGYSQFADGYCLNFAGIPVTSQTPEDSALILEALSYESQDTLTPAYYDICLTGKSIRDEESKDMLDIIFDSYIVDNDEILKIGVNKNFGGALRGIVGIASTVASSEKSANALIEKVNNNLLGIE